ncbi:PH domain-containing protein [Bacillus sp. CHD6a]|uniref:PH domain-containing protein n=1 Tax=Bacillus sp. CHD6a TaxID=1643452 RepID=UPI0006CDF6EA|nr:PH domain-containing protein [Bacillus sp. CHD6a]KPB03802.1 hypothetical protein AAV98_15340 [Bacillus sp. CHD6a]
MEVKITKSGEDLIIKWQFSTINVPLSSIILVENDPTYSGTDKHALRVGFPSGHTDRVVIHTKSDTYLIFTSNGGLRDKIRSYISSKA